MVTKEKKRWKTEGIILAALGHAILEGLKLDDRETIWVGSREDYADGLLDNWLDSDGDIAINKLINLIITWEMRSCLREDPLKK